MRFSLLQSSIPIRLLLATMAQGDLELEQLDVNKIPVW